MLTFLALSSLVHGIGENLDLKIVMIILYGIVTVGFLDPCPVSKVTYSPQETQTKAEIIFSVPRLL